MKQSQKKIRAAKLSVATAISLSLIKFVTGFITGSMAVLSSAIDSMLDIVMSGVNFLAIRQAEQPADENHAYGHGKFETIATLIQSLIIGGSGVWIFLESIRRLLEGSEPTKFGSGIAVLIISVLVSILISNYLKKVAKETDSSALMADSLHFSMDVYTNIALVIGMGVMYWLKLYWIDSVLSLCVAMYIFYEALKLVRLSLKDVLDEQLPEETRKRIEKIIIEHGGQTVNYHNLRTRKAGSQKLIDFHMTVCKHLSVAEAHDLTDELESAIAKAVGDVDVTIHVEPCFIERCEHDRICELEDNGSRPGG
jgi:cation diffusion facilitator family transporter